MSVSAFDDLTERHSVVAVGTPSVVTNSSLWGGASTHFDGDGDWLEVSGDISDLSFPPGQDFCIEFAFRSTKPDVIIVQSGISAWSISTANRNLHFYSNSSSPGVDLNCGLICDGNWHVGCVERSGDSLRGYVDGVVGSTYGGSSYRAHGIGAGPFSIGANAVPRIGMAWDLDGEISHLRITRAGRYAGAYTPSAPIFGAGDPQWGNVVLAMSMSARPIGLHDDLLRRLLPPLSIDRNGRSITTELTVYGDALDASTALADALLAEADPRTTSVLFTDWERIYGLEAGSQTDAQRRASLLAAILAGGGQSRAFYVQLAAALGYTANIIEYRPHTVLDDVEFPLYGGHWRHIWRVRAHANAGAATLAAFEALINKIKPAHTLVQFEYY